jgi:hypothetical protein
MCRNIHTLFNYEPPATEEEVRDASLQYVRKISGFTKPSQANEEAFARAVDEIADATQETGRKPRHDRRRRRTVRSRRSAAGRAQPSGFATV